MKLIYEWTKSEWGPQRNSWNLFAFVFCFVGGLWPLPAAGGPPKEANKDKKQMNEWMKLKAQSIMSWLKKTIELNGNEVKLFDFIQREPAWRAAGW